MSDEAPSYAVLGKLFADHRTIKHSQTYSMPDDTDNNQAESFNACMHRGVHRAYL